MDPQAALLRIIVALDCIGTGRDEHKDARDLAVEGLRDLADWLDRGGAPPKVFISRDHKHLSDELASANPARTPLCVLRR